MKYLLLIAAISFIGCKKTYHCTCVITEGPYTGTNAGNHEIKASPKDKDWASDRCDGKELFQSYVIDCTLK